MFVVLNRPDPVDNLEIDFTTVDVVCRNNETFLELDVAATWSKASVSEDTTFEYYILSINNVQITSVSCVSYNDC